MRNGQSAGPHPAQVGWDEYYKANPLEQVPWYTDRIDDDFASLLEKHAKGLRTVLDLGTGPGTAAIYLARAGFLVTATDISPTAIEIAKSRAGEASAQITWMVDDIVRSEIKGKFDMIHDRGCFHILKPTLRARYVDQVTRLLHRGGLLFIKTFSKREPGDWGPNRFDVDELQSYFRPGFALLASSEVDFPSTFERQPAGLIAVFRLEPSPQSP